MALADIVAAALEDDDAINAAVSGIRPVNAGISDDRPFILYESKGIGAVAALNCVTNNYSGQIVIHVVADKHEQCQSICEDVKTVLNGLVRSDGTYKLCYCMLVDEDDIDQEIDESEKPFYVRALTFDVRGRKLTA